MISVGIASGKIQEKKLSQDLRDPGCGGVVIFSGRVRDHHEGKTVTKLFYECYQPMALKVLRTIADEAASRWPVGKISVLHRRGEVPLGECAVWIGVASIHRKEAFAACEFLIDEIKKRVPIWKREGYADGTEGWVQCHHESE